MAKGKENTTGPADVDAYIAKRPEEAQAALNEMREVIRSIAPGSSEYLDYGMPAFKYGEPFVHFMAWKTHTAFYGIGQETLDAYEDEVKPYEAKKMGTLHFPYSEPLPVDLIRKLVDAHLDEIERNGADPLCKRR